MRQVIYVWNYREWGGAQIYFLSLMKEAQKHYRVSALIPSDSDAKILQYLDSLDVSYEFLDPAPPTKASGINGRIARRTAAWRSESRLTKKILASDGLEYTIVHIDLGFWQSFRPLYRLSKRTDVFMTLHTGLPLMTGLRGWLWRTKGRSLSRLPRFHLLASNNDARNHAEPYLTPEKFDEIEVTYSGFDPDEIERILKDRPDPTKIRHKYSLPPDGLLLITVGQFIERKGCWTLLEGLKILKNEGIDLTFVWLATTLPKSDVLKRIEAYGLGDSFRLIDSDHIGGTRDHLLTLLSVANIFVLASREEGLPIALVEAMALGRPCIATSVGAIPEAVEHGKNGLLVRPNDPSQLAETIKGLATDRQLRESLGTAARETAFDKFNARRTAERTVNIYDAVWKT